MIVIKDLLKKINLWSQTSKKTNTSYKIWNSYFFILFWIIVKKYNLFNKLEINPIENLLNDKEIDDLILLSETHLANNKDMFQQIFERVQTKYYYNFIFGTAGARALMGEGFNCMNTFNIYHLTLAFVNYLKEHCLKDDLKHKEIAIICDSRNNSNNFAYICASVLTNNDIKCKLMYHNHPAPTPFASFITLHKKMLGAIVITASHNNPQFNGYKIYKPNGSQYNFNETNWIYQNYLQNISKFQLINILALKPNYLSFFTKQDINDYIDNAFLILKKPEQRKIIKIILSPRMGTHIITMNKALKMANYEFFIVKQQNLYNSWFNTLENYMNPLHFEGYNDSIQLAKEKNADFIFHTDCDGDRISCLAFNSEAEKYEYIPTTMLVTMIIYYLHELDPENVSNKHFVLSIVSGTLITKICEAYGIKFHYTLTGPKYLIDKLLSKCCSKNPLFAFEQSNGFILSPTIYDKDGLSALLLLSEMFNYYYLKNIDYIKLVHKIGRKFGYLTYLENSYHVINFAKYKKLKKLFLLIKKSQIFKIIDDEIIRGLKYKVIDYNENTQNLKSNFIKLEIEKQFWVIIRPSGTEPLIKFYVHCVKKTLASSKLYAKKLIIAISNYCSNYFNN